MSGSEIACEGTVCALSIKGMSARVVMGSCRDVEDPDLLALQDQNLGVARNTSDRPAVE